MGLPITKLFCVSTAVRKVASPRSPVIGGAKSCQAGPFTSLPSLSSSRKCQLQQTPTAALYTLGHIMSVHQKGKITASNEFLIANKYMVQVSDYSMMKKVTEMVN